VKALSNVKFPLLSELRRSQTEKQHDEINQTRLNQNFKTITDAIVELEEKIELLLALQKEE